MNCRSHYWINNGGVFWAGAISKRKIQSVYRRDKADLDEQIRKQAGNVYPRLQLRPRWTMSMLNWLQGK
jgi:hypothetical protein